MPSRRISLGGRIGYWLAVLSLLLNVLGPLVFAAPVRAGGIPDALSADLAVLCSGATTHPGFRTGDGGSPIPLPDGDHCLDCLPLAGGTGALPAPLTVDVAFHPIVVGNPAPNPPPHVLPRLKPTHSRAPPVLRVL
ncbi:MAG: DUF2946 family protein [Alphaproteobacteria bacterium]|nr:DUF2946 family protein [Alphaproteobacteria bacterium]